MTAGRRDGGRAVVVVCERDAPLSAMLPRLGADAISALAEGRLFVGARRAGDLQHVVHCGEEVIVYPPRPAEGEPARILRAQGGLIAAYKPAEIATIADHRGRAGTLADEVARLTGVPYERLHACSRLDVGVSGVVLFAADEATRLQVMRAREQGAYVRRYVALAVRAPTPSAGGWSFPIGRDRDPRKRRVAGQRATAAHTAYAVVAQEPRGALLAVEPRTGRTHQIRVHAAHAGAPLWGDATYGGPVRFTNPRGAVQEIARIALHALWVEVPYAETVVRVDAPAPEALLALWSALGGDPGAWDMAGAPLAQLGGRAPSSNGRDDGV